MLRIIIFFFFLMSSAKASLAFGQEGGQLQKIDALIACQNIKLDTERLSCFDKTVRSFSEATQSGEIVAVEKNTIQEIEKDSFGFNLPSIPRLSGLLGLSKTDENSKTSILSAEQAEVAVVKPVEKNQLTQKSELKNTTLVELALESVRPFGRDKLRFKFQNGQVWEQTDSRRINKVKISDDKQVTAVIRKRALGSYFLRVNGKGPAVKVRRTR